MTPESKGVSGYLHVESEGTVTDTRRGKTVPVKLSAPLDAKHEEAPSGLFPSWVSISGGSSAFSC